MSVPSSTQPDGRASMNNPDVRRDKRPAPPIYVGQVWTPVTRHKSRVPSREVLSVFADEFGMVVEYVRAGDPASRMCTRSSFEGWVSVNRAMAVERTTPSSTLPEIMK